MLYGAAENLAAHDLARFQESFFFFVDRFFLLLFGMATQHFLEVIINRDQKRLMVREVEQDSNMTRCVE